MSLFGKLKNMVTGGGATVGLEVLSQPVRGEGFAVRVSVTVGDGDVNARKVYLRVVGEEEVQIPGVQVAHGSGNAVSVTTETVSRSTYTYDASWDVTQAITLKGGQTYHWDMEIGVPPDAQPAYGGQLARHQWKAIAGVDVFGNDPDSGWFVLAML